MSRGNRRGDLLEAIGQEGYFKGWRTEEKFDHPYRFNVGGGGEGSMWNNLS